MKLAGIIKALTVGIAALGFCLPQPLLASPPTGPTPVVLDVALNHDGVLLGQVVDPQGLAKANSPVSLRFQEKEVARAVTDANGRFAFSKLQGGVYQLVAANGHGAYRLWAPGTAPPKAERGAMVIAGKDLMRGQYGGGMRFWMSNPWVICGIVATAVAVPVGIHNANRTTAPVSP